MSETNRRKFLAAAGGGTVVGAATLVGGTTGAANAASAPTTRKPGSAKEPLVAYVEDHGSDRLRLMVGDREVVVRDHDLVARLLNAAGGE